MQAELEGASGSDDNTSRPGSLTGGGVDGGIGTPDDHPSVPPNR